MNKVPFDVPGAIQSVSKKMIRMQYSHKENLGEIYRPTSPTSADVMHIAENGACGTTFRVH